MKIILLQDITKLGKRGDVQEVADGYAINVLIKKKQALLASPAELAKWKQIENKKSLAKNTLEVSFAKLLEKLKEEKIMISGLKNHNGHLFSGIKKEEITDAIFQITKISVDPNQIIMPTPIKSLGIHTFLLKQGNKTVTAEIELFGEK